MEYRATIDYAKEKDYQEIVELLTKALNKVVPQSSSDVKNQQQPACKRHKKDKTKKEEQSRQIEEQNRQFEEQKCQLEEQKCQLEEQKRRIEEQKIQMEEQKRQIEEQKRQFEELKQQFEEQKQQSEVQKQKFEEQLKINRQITDELSQLKQLIFSLTGNNQVLNQLNQNQV